MFTSIRPLFYLGKIPITVTGLIILIQLIGMLVWVFTAGAVLSVSSFTGSAFLSGQIWRLITYPIFSSLDIMSLLGLFFFYQFGTEVEKVFERKQFVLLCLSILFIAPIVLIISQLIGLPNSGMPLIGGMILHLAMFCAFCVMHPNAPTLFLRIPIKWLGLAFFAVSVLSFVGMRAWGMVFAYTAGVGLAVWMVQSRGYATQKIFPDAFTIPPPKKPKKKRAKIKNEKTIKPKLKPKVIIPAETEIDAILDKISEHGLHSLTPEERAKLETGHKK